MCIANSDLKCVWPNIISQTQGLKSAWEAQLRYQWYRACILLFYSIKRRDVEK